MSSVHPSTGPPDLNLVLTHMDSSLVNKLMCCAKAVADGDLKRMDVLFEEMEALVSDETNEATKKVVEYFAEALVRRVHGLQPRNPMPLLPSIEMQNYPYTQEIPLHLFATIATNYDMLETLIPGKSKQVHFIDFSMVVSYRYWRDCFLYGKRVHCSQSFRVTSIRPKLSRYDDHLQPQACQQLITPLASQYDIDFQCEEVFANSAAEIVEAVLNLKRKGEDETIIVRWVFELHKLLAQDGAIEKVLSKLKDLRPDIMVIVEQEANHNSLDFFDRFSSSFDYYHSVFEASEQHDTDQRVKLLSEMHLRRQISNVVASEGIDRFERHETLDRWQERLTQAGFLSIPLWLNELKSRSLHPMSEFIIVENNGFPMLRFLKRPLAVVSIWKPGFVEFHMGRHSCCDNQKLRKGFWSPEEDEKLVNHITKHGSGGSWSSVPKLAGLRRCSESCRLRWINYLRPDLKRGAFSEEEKDLIIKLHSLLGNRWSLIASRLPGRTDNDVKNLWYSIIKKKLRQRGIDPDTHRPLSEFENDKEKQQQLTADKSNEKAPIVSNELNLIEAATLKPPAVSSSSSKIVNIQDTDHASPPLETEAASSSDSEDDIRRHPDTMTMTNGTIWSQEEVRMYLLSPLTEKETKRIARWMDRKMTGAFAGLNKRLNVRDTSLKNLLSIPPPFIPIEEEKQYYVDDSVINAFFKLLRKRSEKFPTSYIKNYSLPTWIMSFLLSGKWSEIKALSSSKIKKIVGTLKLFIPVCLEDHWILICVDIEKRVLLWLDSLNSPFYSSKKTIISEWIIKHLLPALGYHNSLEWQFQELLDIPHQSNRVDCGIFIMKYADCLAHGDHFPFAQENIPHFRRRVFLDIYRGRLSVAVSALNLNRFLGDTNGTVWTPTENKRFENALVLYDKDPIARWPPVYDVIKLYRELEEDVSDIEAGLIPPPSFSPVRPSAFNPGGDINMNLNFLNY